MLEKVTKQEYEEFMADTPSNFGVISTFSDPQGTFHHLGSTFPRMDTDYGIRGTDEVLARLSMTKESHFDKEWNYEYFLNPNA